MGLVLENEGAKYEVGDQLTKNGVYNIYLCTEVDTGAQHLLQIATDVVHNGGLERSVYMLKKLRTIAEELEVEWAKVGGERLLSYERLFPQVVDSFLFTEQGRRRVNILSFAEVEDAALMVPLSKLAVDGKRVDLRSSAWILGRLLKLLDMVHSEGIAIRAVATNNVLLYPEDHFAVVFDWSAFQTFPQGEEIPAAIRKGDLAGAAQATLAAIGADPKTGEFPYEIDDYGRRYIEMVVRWANYRESDAKEAHDQLYEFIEDTWGRSFEPFKTLPL